MAEIKRLALMVFWAVLSILALVGLLDNYLSNLEEAKFKVGTTYMTMNNQFYQALNAEIEKQVNAQEGILYTRDPALDVAKQVEQLDAFINSKVDVIILNPVDSHDERLISAVRRAKEAGIHIVVVDSQIKDSSVVDSTIVSDNYSAGVLAAKDMMANLSEAKILILEHHDTQSGTERIQGFKDTILEHSAYEVVARRESLGQTEIAMPQVEGILASGIEFDVIMALNDQAAIGALAALKKHGIERKIFIYGVDGSPDMKHILMTTADVRGTVVQSPLTMGQAAIKVAEKLYQGESVEKKILVPVHLVTKEQADQIEKSGWQ